MPSAGMENCPLQLGPRGQVSGARAPSAHLVFLLLESILWCSEPRCGAGALLLAVKPDAERHQQWAVPKRCLWVKTARVIV